MFNYKFVYQICLSSHSKIVNHLIKWEQIFLFQWIYKFLNKIRVYAFYIRIGEYSLYLKFTALLIFIVDSRY
jgi:hypothetical protein